MKTVKISDELHKKLKIAAAESGLSITALVEDGVSIYFDPLELPTKEDINALAGVPVLGKADKTATETHFKKTTFYKKAGEIHGEDYV